MSSASSISTPTSPPRGCPLSIPPYDVRDVIVCCVCGYKYSVLYNRYAGLFRKPTKCPSCHHTYNPSNPRESCANATKSEWPCSIRDYELAWCCWACGYGMKYFAPPLLDGDEDIIAEWDEHDVCVRCGYERDIACTFEWAWFFWGDDDDDEEEEEEEVVEVADDDGEWDDEGWESWNEEKEEEERMESILNADPFEVRRRYAKGYYGEI